MPHSRTRTRLTSGQHSIRGVREWVNCIATADHNLASEREQNVKCAARGLET